MIKNQDAKILENAKEWSYCFLMTRNHANNQITTTATLSADHCAKLSVHRQVVQTFHGQRTGPRISKNVLHDTSAQDANTCECRFEQVLTNFQSSRTIENS